MINSFVQKTLNLLPDQASEILSHAGFRKYFKNTSWMFLGRFFSLGTSFIVSIYVARYLGPDQYGLLSYAISFVGLFGFLTSLGIDNILSREIVRDPAKRDELIGTGFYIKISGGVAALILTLAAAYQMSPDRFTFFLISIFAFSYIPASFGVIESYFQSQVLSKYVVSSQISANIASAIFKLICIMFGLNLIYFIIANLLESIIYAVGLIVSFKKKDLFTKWRFNRVTAMSLLRDSWPLMLSTMAISIYMKIDQVFIKNMLGNQSAGIYAVAVKMSEAWYYIPSIVVISLFPAIINAQKVDLKLYRKRLSRLYIFMLLSSTIIAIAVSASAYPIIRILLGEDYIGAVPVLRIYIWAGIFVFLGLAISQTLIAENKTRISAVAAISGALVNVIMNIFLIPIYGLEGAAVATLISYAISVFITTFFLYNNKKRCTL